jgi:hypothetical protein
VIAIAPDRRANRKLSAATRAEIDSSPRWFKRGLPQQPQTSCCQRRLFTFRLVSQHTLLTSVAVPQSSVPPISARTENTLIRTIQIAICCCTRIYRMWYSAIERGDAGESETRVFSGFPQVQSQVAHPSMLRTIVQRSLRNLIYREEYRVVPAANGRSRYPPLIKLN